MSTKEILEKLVSIDTIKDKGNEKIINFIENYLLSLGFRTDYKSKILIMSYGTNHKLGFLGHSDTVEVVDGWNTDPHTLIEKDGKLYGLGSSFQGILHFRQSCHSRMHKVMKSKKSLYRVGSPCAKSKPLPTTSKFKLCPSKSL